MDEESNTKVYFVTSVSKGWHTHEICSWIGGFFAQQGVPAEVKVLQQFNNLTEIAITATDLNDFVKDFDRIVVVVILFTLDEMNEVEKRDLKIKQIRDIFEQCKYVSSSNPIVFFDFTR